MYNSPIEIIQNQMYMQTQMEMENGILKAVQNYGINVDKDELIKALNYERNQYDKGYNEGYLDGLNADQWIPCSERLPDNELENAKKERGENALVPVLATVKRRNHVFVTKAFYVDDDCKHFIDLWAENIDVIAWQPLPEPYKGEQE